jgi:hypothetical protein
MDQSDTRVSDSMRGGDVSALGAGGASAADITTDIGRNAWRTPK